MKWKSQNIWKDLVHKQKEDILEDSEQMFIYEITYYKIGDKCNTIFHFDFQQCWKDIMENSYKQEIRDRYSYWWKSCSLEFFFFNQL